MNTSYEALVTEENQIIKRTITSFITVEHGLYILVGLVAIILRLPGLDVPPLSPSEATEALAVWDLFHPNSELFSAGSPIYLSLTGLVSQILGFSDGIMRLVPVIFGVGLVLLPYFLRSWTSKFGSLIASLLLAVSPAFVFTSRTAGGQSAALFFAFLLFIAWLRYQESAKEIWFYTLLVAFALGLASDPIFYGNLICLIGAWLVQASMGPYLFSDEQGRRRLIVWPSKTATRYGLLLAIGAFIISATIFLIFPPGIGSTADILSEWIGLFGANAEGIPWATPLLTIGRYEFVLVIVGLPAIFWALRTNRPFPFFLIYWLVFGFIMIFLQRGELKNVMLVLPGYLLIGAFSGDIFSTMKDWRELSLSIVIIIASGIIYVNLTRYGRLLANNQGFAGSYNLLLIFITLIAAAILFTLIWGWEKAVVEKSVLAGLLVLLVMISWSTAWRITRFGANDTREQMIRFATDDDVPILAATIEELSWQLDNSEREVEILTSIESPSLRWYLREFTNLKMNSALPPTVDTALIITSNDNEPELATKYVGSDFGHLRLHTPQEMSLSERLRWWLFHESPTQFVEERVILWIRSDMVGGIP